MNMMLSFSVQAIIVGAALLPTVTSSRSPLDPSVLVDLTSDVLPEALKTPDGSAASTKRVSFSTNGVFYNISDFVESFDSGPGVLSHVTSSGFSERTEKKLLTRVSKVAFSCLCADLRCTKAVAADLRGVLNPNLGQHRQTSPLILHSPDGQPLPCLSLQAPIRLNEAQVTGCSLLDGVGDFGELLVAGCENDTVSSFRIIDRTMNEVLARTLSPKEFTVRNAIEIFIPDPRVSMGNLFGTINITDPVPFRIPVNENINVGGTNFPVNFVIEFDAADSMEQAGRVLVKGVLDGLIRTLWPTDFNESNPGSEAGQDEMMRILFRFAFYGYFQSQHTSFEKQESRQLESIGQYVSIKEGRPQDLSLTEVVTNAVVLIAAAASLGWSVGRIIKSGHRKEDQNASEEDQNGFDLSTVATLAGSTVALLGALAVFIVQWMDMRERLDYSESIIVLEVMMFSRTSTAFFGRVFRDFDIASIAMYAVHVQDVSADYTWLFVLGTMLTITSLAVAGILGATDNPNQLVRNRWVAISAIIWFLAIVVVPLVVGLTMNNNMEHSTVYSAASTPPVGNSTLPPTGPPAQSLPPATTAPEQSTTPTAGPPVPIGVPGGITCKNCCGGSGACSDNNGTIADGSCNGDNSCVGNSGDIGPGSCNGYYSCRFNTKTIGVGSCLERSSCKDNNGQIGDDSCNGYYACQQNEGMIGKNSCSGRSACEANGSEIGDDVCNANYACQ